MTRLHPIVFAAAALFGCVSAVLAQAPKPAADAEQAVAALEAAAKAGDVDAFLSALAEPQRKVTRDLYSAVESVVRANKALDAALDAKFGPSATARKRPDFDPKKTLTDIVRLEIVSKEAKGDKRVDLRLRTVRKGADGKDQTSDEPAAAVLEAGGWKVIPPRMEDVKRIEGRIAAVRRAVEAAEQVNSDLTAGRHKTREDADKAYDRALIGDAAKP